MSEELGFIRDSLTRIEENQARHHESNSGNFKDHEGRISTIEGAQKHSRYTVPIIVSAVIALASILMGFII